MKKILLFVPAALALVFYIILGYAGGFGTISPYVWISIALMFVSAFVMFKGKWYGCIGGIVIGLILIYISTRYTGQVIDIERPAGIVFCIYHLVCGIVLYRRKQENG